jgi:hypothetical protein
VRARFAALFGLVVILALAPAAQAAPDRVWVNEAKVARKALDRSTAAGYVTASERARYLGILSHARVVRNRVPPGRARMLDDVLRLVTRSRSPTGPRALVLYSTLAENVSYLARHRIPGGRVDIADDDGIVYRWFTGSGFAFHPLANASKLNALVTAGKKDEARTLAAALADRASPKPDGAEVWEYQFDFDNVRAPWTSGMAQAVMAQALARAGRDDLARLAFQAIPGHLDRSLPAGPWIRLYSKTSALVLNAQLQSAVSLTRYADLTGDTQAGAYAKRLLATARTLIPRYDTGHWSSYSPGIDAPLEYHDYVIDLLKLVRPLDDDPVWTDMLKRFQLYETQPPELTGPSVTPVVYPRPEDGVRDELSVRFWLSKPSHVVLVLNGKAVDGMNGGGGWHTFRWTPSELRPGTYPVRLVARSVDGQSGSADLPSFTVELDRTAPVLSAAKANGRVFWRAKDAESACCHLRLELRRSGEQHAIALERRKGAAAIPQGYWSVAVVARDAAGNVTRRELGLVVGHGRVPWKS